MQSEKAPIAASHAITLDAGAHGAPYGERPQSRSPDAIREGIDTA